MKIYKVKVNGKLYEVEVESVSEQTASIQPVPTAAAPSPTPAQPTEGVMLKAPMQGTILDVKVKAGDSVKKGQCIFILEAMKLENEIVSPATGIISSISVTKGQAVNNQDVLAVIK